MSGIRFVLVGLLMVGLAGCAAPQVSPGLGSQRSQQTSSATAGRTLKMVVRYEVSELLPKISGPSSPSLTRRVFNAALALVDNKGEARPYLAEALPQLHTETWRVFPDGRMETTYRLRPNLTWHNGAPLTAQDFVFAYGVYGARGLGVFLPAPHERMEKVVAMDPRTLVVRWSSLYPDAGAIVDEEFEPLPRHILEQPFSAYLQDPGTRDAFLTNRFWTTEYVGAGEDAE